MLWDNIKKDIDTIEQNNECIEKYFNNLSSKFCLLNQSPNNFGDSIIILLVQHPKLFSKNFLFKFSVNNAYCLQDLQRETLKKLIESSIIPFERYFHELVCNYNINAFNDILYEFSNVDDLKKIKTDFLEDNLSASDILILKNLATLSVLGDESIENALMDFIRDIFLESKELFDSKPRLMLSLYTKVLPSTIALFKSKSSVLNSLYLFENNLSISSGLIYFDSLYYDLIIKPKIDPNVWIYIRPSRMKEKKIEIISKILHDDSIWKDNIKLEK
ncbi:MAG TPA: hypothetical protein ENK91_12765 [Bacteroidetes bacterium]|nr:hypothetical protein [Bacteroidota bacterium]